MKEFTLISRASSSDPFANLPVINICKDARQQGANRADASDIRAHSERIATRYDKLAANFLSAVAIATAIAFWL